MYLYSLWGKSEDRMKFFKLSAAMCAILLLTACAVEEEIYDPEPAVTVSPLAEENFLEPVTDFSWARQFPPEKVMLHFSSAVVLQRDDPYDLEAVRKIFIAGEISVHYIIDRDGKIHCWIPEDRVAWHAGAGEFVGDARHTNAMNQYAIGIEVLAIGSERDMAQYLTPAEYAALPQELLGFTDAQYDAIAALVQDLCTRYAIPMDRAHIIGHEEYSPTKTDPGELFSWERIVPDLPK